jgi:hypothetical protein
MSSGDDLSIKGHRFNYPVQNGIGALNFSEKAVWAA